MQNFRSVHCLLVHPFGRPFILLLDLVLMTNQMKVNTSRGIVTQAIFLWEEDTEFYKEYFLNCRVFNSAFAQTFYDECAIFLTGFNLVLF